MPGLRLLALDGGGVRGLVSLLILRRLLYLVNHRSPPKPCEVFDFIAGTSTGGLVAIMLGRLEMDIESCIEAYVKLSEHVFTSRKRSGLLGKKLMNLIGQEIFNHETLEDAIKRVVRQSGCDENAPLLQASPKCKTLPNSQTVRLRNYLSSREERVDCTIWEAGRATSAAPTFFDPITFSNGGTFRDGALRDNNPIYELMHEVEAEASGLEIASIISIGTGRPRSIVIGNGLTSVAEACVRIATDAEKDADRFHQSFCLSGGKYEGCYFRFNVVSGIGGIRLDEWQKSDLMRSSTLSYLQEAPVTEKLQTCARKIRQNPPTTTSTSSLPEHCTPEPQQAPASPLNPSGTAQRCGGESSHHSIVDSFDRASARSEIVAGRGQAEGTLTRRPQPPSDHGFQHHFYQLDRIGKQPVPFFVHRDELPQIGDLFATPTQPGSTRVVLVGLGGSGKTQIMLQYAWSSREEYGVVLWFDARSTVSLRESLRLAASQLGLCLPAHEAPKSSKTELSKYTSDIESYVRLITRELHRRQQPWLLLFDGADGLSTIDRLPNYMPSDPNGRILISSRRKEAARLGHTSIRIAGMPVDGAARLLLHLADITNLTPGDSHYAKKIVQRLGCIALAVDLAGTFTQSLGTLKEYLTRYESKKASVRDEVRQRSLGRQHPIASGYDMSVIAAWKVSIQAISPEAANFLYLLCFLDPTNLSMDMFRRACSGKAFWDGMSGERAILTPQENRVPPWLINLFCDHNGSWNDLKFYEVVQELASFFFLHKEVLDGAWLHASGTVEASSLTSDGSEIVLLKLPQPVYDLGKYYLNPERRREFGYNAFSIIIHSFRNSIDDRILPSHPSGLGRHAVLHACRGGSVSNPAHLQRQLEEGYNHLLVFKDDIKPSERFSPRLFRCTNYPKWHLMELILFGTLFWPELMSQYESILPFRSHAKVSPELQVSPWQTIIEIAQNAMYRPIVIPPRGSGIFGIITKVPEESSHGRMVRENMERTKVPKNTLAIGDAFEQMDQNFGRKWVMRQNCYHKRLATSSLYRERLKPLRHPLYRISSLAEGVLLKYGTAPTDLILQRVRLYVRELSKYEEAPNMSPLDFFECWLSSPLGAEFIRRCNLPLHSGDGDEFGLLQGKVGEYDTLADAEDD